LMGDSRLIEKKVENFLKYVFKPENSFNRKKLQKRKFFFLSKLVADLFNSKNSQICFNNISNLIILILNIYNEKFPVDDYSSKEDNSLKNFNSECKHFLKYEFFNE